MENTETADVVHRPELTIKEILVTATVAVSGASPFVGEKVDRTASFAVNTETWECKGEIASGGPDMTMVDEEWWAGQCKRVSDRVRASIQTLNV
jgi:hypothetical protein